VLFGLSMPSTPEKWFTLLWTMVLGSVAFALMAIGYSSMIPNPRSAAAMVTPPFIVLQFISGVFFPYSELPRWMQAIAALFPLKWIVQGIHSVFLPDSFQSQEIAGSWEHPKTSLVLLAWCVIAAYACIRKFRWRDMS
jgi:ABC-2 type transport system permease protein